jgi:serine/threonine-protein kinase
MTSEMMSHYHILKKLGAGGMGEVYLAQDTKLDRAIALKIMSADVAADQMSVRRFLQEAKAASALSHPNVCVIYEVGETDDGRLFMAMEYIEGQALEAKISDRALDLAEMIDIGLQIADALDEAHSKGIIHRDIKPSNVMITARGQVKVLDFGLAKLTAKDPSADSDVATRMKSSPGLVMGTAAYMSPEQALGQEVDQRTDLFSLGVVLYQMATGALPFQGNNSVALFDAILHKIPTPPIHLNPELPVELEQIIIKALEKDRDMRYQTGSDLRADLKRVKRDTDSARVVIPSAVVPGARRRLHRRLAGPLIGVTLALLLVLLIPSSRQTAKKWLRLEAVPDEKHLVVLPFTNVGNDPTDQAFCDGLVETLTSELTQLEPFSQPSLWVVPASEVRQSRVSGISEAARKFGITLAVSGSVQRQGDRVRLTLNLVDAKTLRQLESSVIDAHLGNISALQDGVVSKLAEMLELQLKPQPADLLAAGSTTVPSAYDFYLQGRGYLQRYEKTDNLDTAIDLFKRALQEDPRYALAYAGLGEAYWRKYEVGKDAQWVETAVSNCERAIQLNDQLAPVHVTLGRIYTGTGRNQEAVQEFQRALRFDPVSADGYRGLAKVYEALGRFDEAESTYKRAIELRPSYWAGYNDLGAFYYRQSRYEAAAEQFRQVVALTPDNFWGYNNLGGLYFLMDRLPDARQMFERSIKIEPNYGAYSNLGTLYFEEGRSADATRMFEAAAALDSHDYQVWGFLASAYYWTPGQRDKALEIYQRAAEMAEAQRKVNPRDPRLLCDLAGFYGALGQRGKAVSLLEQALVQAPEDMEVMALAGGVYEELGERERALEWIGKALDHGYSLDQIQRAPVLQKLRADPRLQHLLQRQANKP